MWVADDMMTIIKVLLVIIGIIVFGVICYFLASFYSYFFEWPIWGGWLGVAFTLFLIILILLALRAFKQWREKQMTEEMMEQKKQDKEVSKRFWNRRQYIQSRWKEIVGLIKKSKINQKGDPLYVLPWFVVMGEKGCGKTTLVKNNKISSPFDNDLNIGDALENDVRWWFLEDSMVLDLPGHYVNQNDADDRADWRHFLLQLFKYRKQQPLNAVVLALAADKLLRSSDDEIRATATIFKDRLEEMVQKLGVNFPVYLAVSKCDQIQGMSRFFNYFPSQVQDQAMGMLNERYSEHSSVTRFVEHAFLRVSKQLDKLRLSVVGNMDTANVDIKAMLFPNEFVELSGKLTQFVKIAFKKNDYHEHPYLRGLYFTSALQEGLPISNVFPRIGFPDEVVPQSTDHKSFFLKDFFRKILKRDKEITYPTKRRIGWENLTQNLGLTAWVAVCVLAALLLTGAFTKNIHTFNNANGEIPGSVALTGSLSTDLENISKFRLAIEQLEEKNDSWWLPRLGLNHTVLIEERLQRGFVKKYKAGVLSVLDKEITNNVKKLDENTPPVSIAKYVDLLSKRIRILDHMKKNGDLDEFNEELPDFAFMLGGRANSSKSKLPGMMRDDYLAYLKWEGAGSFVDTEYQLQEKNLRYILSEGNVGLNWLVNWANIQDNLEDITLKQFWGSQPEGDKNVIIPRAYTPKGWEAIDTFIKNIEAVQIDPSFVRLAREDFQKKYRRDYFVYWQRFLENFHNGGIAWKGRDRKFELIARLATQESPYRKMLSLSDKHLKTAMDLSTKPEHVPDWVWLIKRFVKLQNPAYIAALEGTGKFMDRLTRGGKIGKIKRLVGNVDNEDTQRSKDKKAYLNVKSYFESIESIAEHVENPESAYKLAKKVYQKYSDVGEPKVNVLKNYWDQKQLRKYIGQGGPSEEIFWRLLENKTSFMWSVVVGETESQLQKYWEQEVLTGEAAMGEFQEIQDLIGKDGRVWVFKDKHAAPFIERSRSRKYIPRKVFGYGVKFAPEFLNMLSSNPVGALGDKSEFKVKVGTIPTDTNFGAVIRPHKVTMELQCGEGKQEVVNQQFRYEKEIIWNPNDCGDVFLKIFVGDLVLSKKYSGYRGFVSFLRHFRTGHVVFRKKDFPQAKGQLTGYRIKYIIIKYSFKGHREVIQSIKMATTKVPDVIVASIR